MGEDLIRVTPNKEKARSILKMVEKTLEMIDNLDIDKFPSNITKEYYEVIRELLSIVLLLDGYKTYGEGAHKKLIEYLETNYKEFTKYETSLIDNLRNTRNKIAYDGFFVEKDYIERKKKDIDLIIKKLKEIIKKKLS
jgi:hypothetical protein